MVLRTAAARKIFWMLVFGFDGRRKIVINLKKNLNPRNFQVLSRKAKEDGL